MRRRLGHPRLLAGKGIPVVHEADLSTREQARDVDLRARLPVEGRAFERPLCAGRQGQARDPLGSSEAVALTVTVSRIGNANILEDIVAARGDGGPGLRSPKGSTDRLGERAVAAAFEVHEARVSRASRLSSRITPPSARFP